MWPPPQFPLRLVSYITSGWWMTVIHNTAPEYLLIKAPCLNVWHAMNFYSCRWIKRGLFSEIETLYIQAEIINIVAQLGTTVTAIAAPSAQRAEKRSHWDNVTDAAKRMLPFTAEAKRWRVFSGAPPALPQHHSFSDTWPWAEPHPTVHEVTICFYIAIIRTR